ncbi:hypothetical protein [Ethanoligenens sp.]|uniref:hypothetical protein n=1 Tax=Ethanoligenens sp. TaxID=2099655 RepID=UPI0039ED94A3
MNMVVEITAPPAGGKTVTLKKMIPMWLSGGARVVVLTSGGDEYLDVCTQADGTYTTITEKFTLDHLPDENLAVYIFDDAGFSDSVGDLPRKILIQFSDFISKLARRSSQACYFVLDDWPFYSCAEDLVYQLADKIQYSNVSLVFTHQPFPYQFRDSSKISPPKYSGHPGRKK